MAECDCRCDCRAIRNVSSELTFKDHLGSLRVRCGIGRMSYRVDPGLYSVGEPDDTSPVFVCANYKLTFDSLRKELSGMDCYILILDTKGVNVWCAAGKGTFGTEELVNRITSVELKEVVSLRTLLLPQLGAPGMSAHEVERRTGFDVVYGPVRASDIKRFLDSGMKATDDMRTVKFTTRDRTVLTPVEFAAAMKVSLIVFGMMFLLNMFTGTDFGPEDVAAYLGAVIMGTVVTPILLPIIPGRAFSVKGWIVGIGWMIFIIWMFGWHQTDLFTAVGYMLILPSLSAYLAMNFTGSSTFTSLSGVKKEVRLALPVMMLTITIGIIILVAGKVI